MARVAGQRGPHDDAWRPLSDIEVPVHGVVEASDGAMVYFTRRFDRVAQGERLPLEDGAQLLGMTLDTKYDLHGAIRHSNSGRADSTSRCGASRRMVPCFVPASTGFSSRFVSFLCLLSPLVLAAGSFLLNPGVKCHRIDDRELGKDPLSVSKPRSSKGKVPSTSRVKRPRRPPPCSIPPGWPSSRYRCRNK